MLGLVAGVCCAYAIGLKYRFGFDDSLDVVGVHLVGGLVGTIGVGFLATAEAPAKVDGLFYAGTSVLPGIGLPMCLISAELVVKRLRGDDGAARLPEPSGVGAGRGVGPGRDDA